MSAIDREATIEKLKEIQKARTHCQCSREKVIEKIAFDYAIEVVKKMSERFETVGLNSDFFEKECLSIRLFSILLGLVIENEKKCRKNKTELEKRTKKKATLSIQKKSA